MAYDRKQGDERVSEPGGVQVDYRTEIGRVYVSVGEERAFVVLDPDRAALLRAWTSALIPASGQLPAAGDVGAAEYIDATAFLAPRIRGLLLDALRAVDNLASRNAGRALVDCDPRRQVAILREFEAVDGTGAFSMVRELTYEAYYAHPRVLNVLGSTTGWRADAAVSGSALEEFDEALLARMKKVKPHYRKT